MAQHTPGPWFVDPRDQFEIQAPDGGDEPWNVGKAYSNCGYGYGNDESEANARLIAAAPDLLALAQLVHGSFGGGRTMTFTDKDIEDFRAAIAKATGEA